MRPPAERGRFLVFSSALDAAAVFMYEYVWRNR
jgi:hypothetical protein